jgi:SAM-dependent methyltransferase
MRHFFRRVRGHLEWMSRQYLVPTSLAVFPPIDDEITPHRGLLTGRVLNAGSGSRDISALVPGELINQDLTWDGDTRTNVHIKSPLHAIPVADGHFDAILCIAVLEHVENPEEVLAEMYRVLKPGGHLIISVPFLQPEHKVPTDFQRYTKDGLVRTVSQAGFEVRAAKPLFSVYHTFYWQAHIWLHLKHTPSYWLLRVLILRGLLWMAKRSTLQSEQLASAFQVIACKPATH